MPCLQFSTNKKASVWLHTDLTLAQALSLALVLGAVGGGLFLVFKLKFQGGNDAGSANTADPDSPLEKARDIWNKYK